MRIGLIDLGTNSVRFDVYELELGQKPLRLHREKLMVRLGENLFLHGSISKSAAQRTIDAFLSFKHTAEQLDVAKILAVATSAVREASDGEKFAENISKRTGIPLRVISGMEEARLIALGVLNNEELPDGQFGLIDIGGGSTEVAVCRSKEMIVLQSLKIGAARLHQLFLKGVPPKDRSSVSDLRKHVRSLLRSSPLAPYENKVKIALGSSGTVRAVGKILQRKDSKEGVFSRKDLSALVERMQKLTPERLLEIPGMEENRVDLILSGSLILEEIIDFLGVTQIRISEHSLRDGLLFEEQQALAEKKRPESGTTTDSLIRRFSALGLKQSETSWLFGFCSHVFQAIQSTHKMTELWSNYICCSAAFLRVGRKISLADQPSHSHYMATHSDLPSLTPRERTIVAHLCLYIDKKKVKDKDLHFLADKTERTIFLQALSLLRIIHALTDVQPCLTRKPSLYDGHHALHIALYDKSLFYLRHLRFEKQKALFEELFGLRVILELSTSNFTKAAA